jgi:peptide/nickel transport system ATP-binding protein
MSGGMNRRVLVSTAMMGNPRLVIADEPTPGLHMKMVRRVMEHFRELADQGAGVLLITHDLEQALEVADRVVVFYAGTTVEDADVKDFEKEETLRHPYSKALWRALPQNGFQFISGTQPYVKELPEGCPFGPRCEKCTEECKNAIAYREVRGGRVRCIHAE